MPPRCRRRSSRAAVPAFLAHTAFEIPNAPQVDGVAGPASRLVMSRSHRIGATEVVSGPGSRGRSARVESLARPGAGQYRYPGRHARAVGRRACSPSQKVRGVLRVDHCEPGSEPVLPEASADSRRRGVGTHADHDPVRCELLEQLVGGDQPSLGTARSTSVKWSSKQPSHRSASAVTSCWIAPVVAPRPANAPPCSSIHARTPASVLPGTTAITAARATARAAPWRRRPPHPSCRRRRVCRRVMRIVVMA
jgi:hypothetical protein